MSSYCIIYLQFTSTPEYTTLGFLRNPVVDRFFKGTPLDSFVLERDPALERSFAWKGHRQTGDPPALGEHRWRWSRMGRNCKTGLEMKSIEPLLEQQSLFTSCFRTDAFLTPSSSVISLQSTLNLRGPRKMKTIDRIIVKAIRCRFFLPPFFGKNDRSCRQINCFECHMAPGF